ncbi:DUF2079 domain-containing protein [Actinomyces sp. 2119]|uniref:DUF2079 domain-containing protein n=1 Tax=Actinomyces lilanjuaniae TaxID=2321394 RepID=A0ABM6Z5S5_9ACTO|nr:MULTISPECIES: DUF2079 domain-containing protein [Actinomyces]AYD90698.1 DUF2079 domain-containing protein [Actinomyces lilanjuaniae]RJF44069.1 DUF2079 domain-containing protein [Actinomyces sp. 2119]
MISFSVVQWRTMQVPSWDLAIFSELAKAYSRLEAPIVPIKADGYNLLGDHFHPILVLLGPVWRVFPSPLALLVVQDLLLAVSAWPLTRLAARLTNAWVGGVLGLVYVTSWGLQGAVAAQFHEVALAVPMLAWASAAFVERRWAAVAAWSVPLVLVKEDLGLTVLVIGLVTAWTGWREPSPVRLVGSLRVRVGSLGLGLALFGLLAFVVTTLVLLPMLNPEGTWAYGLGSPDGTDPTSQGSLLARLVTPTVKLETLAVLVATGGVIALRSPWVLVAAPTLAWRFLGSVEFYWEWRSWHYNAVLIPIALGALLDVLARLRTRRAEVPQPQVLTAPASSQAPAPAGKPQRPASPDPVGTPRRPTGHGWRTAPRWVRAVAAVGLLVPVMTAALTAPHLPLWAMTQDGFAEPSERTRTAQQVINSVPEGASVETDLSLLAYLVPKAEVSWVGTSESDKDYVVVDQWSSAWGGNPPADAARWAEETSTEGSSYELVLDTNGFQVARRLP